MSEQVELRVLGALELVRAGAPVPVGGVKPRQLLATLGLQPGRTVSVDQLIEVLWPGQPPRSAVANVHTYVSRLRQLVGEDRLRRQPPGYRLHLGDDELDATRFLAYAQSGAVDEALALWRGDPVEDLPVAPGWRAELNRLMEAYRTVRLARCRRWIEAGEPGHALTDLRALVAEDPVREEGWHLLVTALEAGGHRAEALAVYATARRTLAEELGIEPGEPLRRLHHRLLSGPAPVTTAVPRLGPAAAGVLRAMALFGPEPVPAWVGTAALDRPWGLTAALDRPHGLTPVRELTATMNGVGGPGTPDGLVAALDRPDILSVLDNLASARLIRHAGVDQVGQDRYRLPALIQLLAKELPGESENELLGRVLGGYLSLAERAAGMLGRPLFSPGRQVATRWPVPEAATLVKDPLAWFAAERQPLCEAVRLATRSGHTALAWELAHTVMIFCDRSGHWAEWEQTHREALAACRQAGDLLGETVILRGIGQLQLYRDHYDAAFASFSRARLGYARLGLTGGEAGALAGLGTVQRIRGELDAAQANYEEALAGYQSVGDRTGEAYAHGLLGAVWLARGRLPEATRCLAIGLRIAREQGDRHRRAHLIHRLAGVRVRAGQPKTAHRLLSTALEQFVDLGDAHGQAYCLYDLAALGSGEVAIQRLTGALEIFERIGDRSAQARTVRLLGELHHQTGQRNLGRAYLAEAGRLSRSVRPDRPAVYSELPGE